jgi:hypothetical protein
MVDEDAERLHGRRRNHPVLAPALDMDFVETLPLKSMFLL